MKVLIEEYRGFEIYFNTETENFYAQSEDLDFGTKKRSFVSAKKYIDDFIKDNVTFQSVEVMTVDRYSDVRTLKLIGIRKDGRFIYEGKNGEPQQLSSYNEKDYFLVNPANEPVLKEIDEVEAEIKIKDARIKELKSQIIRVGLDEIKKKYLR